MPLIHIRFPLAQGLMMIFDDTCGVISVNNVLNIPLLERVVYFLKIAPGQFMNSYDSLVN
jgi:hypothetical protein